MRKYGKQAETSLPLTTVSLVPRPHSQFFMLHSDKWEGVVQEIIRESLGDYQAWVRQLVYIICMCIYTHTLIYNSMAPQRKARAVDQIQREKQQSRIAWQLSTVSDLMRPC